MKPFACFFPDSTGPRWFLNVTGNPEKFGQPFYSNARVARFLKPNGLRLDPKSVEAYISDNFFIKSVFLRFSVVKIDSREEPGQVPFSFVYSSFSRENPPEGWWLFDPDRTENEEPASFLASSKPEAVLKLATAGYRISDEKLFRNRKVLIKGCRFADAYRTERI